MFLIDSETLRFAPRDRAFRPLARPNPREKVPRFDVIQIHNPTPLTSNVPMRFLADSRKIGKGISLP
jgi:hypothetical protein